MRNRKDVMGLESIEQCTYQSQSGELVLTVELSPELKS